MRRVSDPETLALTRTDVAHLVFGQRHHYCPGAGVARTELHAAFSTLALRLPSPCHRSRWSDWRTADPAPEGVARGVVTTAGR
ncbi:hypothetical protein [Streptomyces sp. NPDC010273]|uniref:hypothetical protein n=1 Tax=Streptomyces sp. NPDC010273 TaxID=3364829 RepID=UPI0036EC4957